VIAHHVNLANILARSTTKSPILSITSSHSEQIGNYFRDPAKWSRKYIWVCISTENVLSIK